MRGVQLAEERLRHLLAGFGRARVAVLGDFFLDKYLEVDPALEEKSLETGLPAHQVVRVRSNPGAAGAVVDNLVALGAGQVHAIGYTGDDGEGFELRRRLEALACDTTHLHVAGQRLTPTYLKPRALGQPGLRGEHPRYDSKNHAPTGADLERRLVASLDALLPHIDALIAIDQVPEAECGVLTSAVRQALIERAATCAQVLFWADSRRRLGLFRRLVLKPNQFELVGAAAPRPGDEVEWPRLVRAGRRLRQRNQAPVLITCGERGMLVSDPEWTQVPAVRLEGEIDPTGAGDSVTAGAVLALCSGAALPEAALVGNLVASLTIQQLATTGTARPEELPPRLALWRRQQGLP